VLVPFRRGPNLVAFSCLGPKRSGDIYTPTDLAWLGAVAGKVSDRLLALDATAVAEQARAMQEALRRYVPGAVAARLASGQDIEAGEREVTVLFVDIRGYTGFSEAREAEDTFHTVNRYTETVSQVVRARGGSVVEFHGDGLLAVFGAPDEMPMKERAAVQSGCEIVGDGRLARTGGEWRGEALRRGGDRHRAGVRRQHPVVRSSHLDGDRRHRQSRRPPAEHDARARRGGGHRRHHLSPRRAGDVRGVRAPCGSGHSRPRPARDGVCLAAVTAPLYAWFTEGFDTKDLRDAKALPAAL
jgi:class 3 adenylate cyclase